MSHYNNNNRYFQSQPPPSQASQYHQQRQQQPYQPQQQQQQQLNKKAGSRPRPSSFGRNGPFDRKSYHQRHSNNDYHRNQRRPTNERYSNQRSQSHFQYNSGRNSYGDQNGVNTPNIHAYKQKDEPHLDSKDENNSRWHSENQQATQQRRWSGPFLNRNNQSPFNRSQVREAARQGRETATQEIDTASQIGVDEKNWAPKRKGREFVKGGRIAKKRRTDEYPVDDSVILRCDVCDITFRDLCEKIAHDESRDHINNKDLRRSELLVEQSQQWSEPIAVSPFIFNRQRQINRHGPQSNANENSYQGHQSINAMNAPGEDKKDSDKQDPVDAIIEQYSALLSSSENVPQSFKSWAHRSLKDGKAEGCT